MCPRFDPAPCVAVIMTRLRAAADEERRIHTAGYFPTVMEILGVGAPVIRAAAREQARALRSAPPEAVLAVARGLIATRTHEGRQAAFELIAARRDVTPLLDGAMLGKLGRGNDNWASVDSFSVNVAGPAWREGHVADREVMEWAADDDVWWRRTALVATVALNTRSRGGHGDVARTLRVCKALVADRHPMIVKALSWALRQLVAHDRAAVSGFLARHDVAPLVRREVITRLRTGTKAGKRVLRDASS